MGKRGPKKMPTALVALRGGKSTNPNEPKPPTTDRPPSPPKHLSDEAKKVWRRKAKSLHAEGLLTAWDVEAFAIYCQAYADVQLFNELKQKAPLITGYRGDIRKSPALQPYREACELVLRAGARFGQDPSSRAELNIGHGSGKNSAKERFITR